MVQYEKVKPLLKRVPTIIDRTQGIQRWDSDNLYPQRCIELVSRSYTLKATMDVVADFLNGEGFEDQNVAKLIVNEDGETMNKILKRASKYYAEFKTITLHIGYDMNFNISSIRVVPIEYLRFSLPDEDGYVCHIKYCTNWESDIRRTNKRKVTTYNLFNPDPNIVEQQIEEAGGIDNYEGQIVFLTPELYQYPKASFDPVFDHAQTQSEIGISRLAGLQNAFVAMLAIVYPGEFQTDEEKAEFTNLIKNKSGSRNMGSNIGFQDPSGQRKASDMFQPLTPPNIDKLYDSTDQASKDAIMENEAMPKELLGVRPDTGMFNQENMEQSYIYVNAKTRNRRNELSEFFSMLLTYWNKNIESDCKIKPQQYSTKPIIPKEQMQFGSQTSTAIIALQTAISANQITYQSGIAQLVEIFGMNLETASAILSPIGQNLSIPVSKESSPDKVNSEGAKKQIQQPSLNEPARVVNPHLQNLTAKQSQQLDRIARKFKSGVLTEAQAMLQIQQGFGLTPEEAKQYLDTTEN